MLAILDLFSDSAPAWTTEDMIGKLQFSRPTVYRYVKELCNAGLLLRLTGGLYIVGPRIIELDLLVRRSDPLLRVARPIMRDLVAQTSGDVLLANVYGDQVMVVHREHGPAPVAISYDRGRPHPLFRGATAKAVLPFLPRAQLRRLFETRAREVRAAGLGRTWEEFRAGLAEIRRQGFVIGHGELDPDVIGIAAPIFADQKRVLGSLVLIVTKQHYQMLNQDLLRQLVVKTSDRITAFLTALSPRNSVGDPSSARTRDDRTLGTSKRALRVFPKERRSTR
jgi:DNA-binding IclR family transcriptional regulator